MCSWTLNFSQGPVSNYLPISRSQTQVEMVDDCSKCCWTWVSTITCLAELCFNCFLLQVNYTQFDWLLLKQWRLFNFIKVTSWYMGLLKCRHIFMRSIQFILQAQYSEHQPSDIISCLVKISWLYVLFSHVCGPEWPGWLYFIKQVTLHEKCFTINTLKAHSISCESSKNLAQAVCDQVWN